MALGTKIPVTVLTGPLGSGKTTLLNRVLRPSASGETPRVAVVLNELGAASLDHKLARHVGGNISVLASGCACCSVSGELVDTLRELFMAALHRKIPVFSRVLIEASGMASPVPIMHTLQYQAFLRERYAYDGNICVIDAEHGVDQSPRESGVLQLAALADLVVMGKADLVAPESLARIEQAVRAVNPHVPVYSSAALPALEALFAQAVRGAGAGRQHLGLFSNQA